MRSSKGASGDFFKVWRQQTGGKSMKKRRMRLTALLLAALMICGLAIAEPAHEHQWSP